MQPLDAVAASIGDLGNQAVDFFNSVYGQVLHWINRVENLVASVVVALIFGLIVAFILAFLLLMASRRLVNTYV
ncbi:hypothetical protein AWB89_09380 [Mycobacterium paraense]|nr:hypothetical protein AWB89_09380 [Mycobacterium paraense]